jgi:photosystem II stability/assembly factor-like uncharacterized protein
MNKKIIYLTIIGIVLLLTGASCSGCGTKKDGGIYRSEDQGENWTQKSFIQQIKRKTYTMGSYTILALKFDPKDANIVYVGTKGQGILLSKNGGENWETTAQKTGNIYSLDIDTLDTNIIYATNDYSILKSTDQGATWETVHTESKKQNFSNIIIDTFDHNKIYAASLSGIVYKSWDQGNNWEIKLQLEDDKIKNIFMRPDTRVLYALTDRGDILKTITGGELEGIIITEPETKAKKQENTVNKAWTSIFTEEHKEKWPTAKSAANFFIFKEYPNIMYMTTQHGLMKSSDEGKTWTEVSTLIPLEDNDNKKIDNLLLDPQNSSNMYFTITNSSKIYISSDAGNNWHIIENFPSTRYISKLIIDPQTPQVLYAGMLIPEEKKGLIKTK